MKKSIFLITTALMILGCGTTKQTTQKNTSKKEIMKPVDPTVYGISITAEELKEMLYIYASDEFQGRETGEPGQKMAVEYLKEKYVSMDIPSPLTGDDYFQEVPLEKKGIPNATMTINSKTFNNYEDVVALAGDSQTFNVKQIVYAGYGIETDTYSDYKDIDVKGKVVLIKAGEPTNVDGTFVTSGTTEPTKWSRGRQALASKRNAAIEKGAKAMILVDEEQFASYSQYLSNAANTGASSGLSLKTHEETMFIFIANEMLGKALYADFITNNTPKIVPTDVTISIDSKSEDIISENVVAIIKGSEKPDEIIVISAHLDHEGVKNGEIYNGADDDGSGTIAILEIAEAFKKAADAGHGPKRTILFLHVTAEEKGLLGSRYYTDIDPVFPLENTVANLNIDMIGRTDPKHVGERNYIYLIGSDRLSSELHTLSEEVNKKYSNITLDYKYNDENDPNRYYYRSDHYNFAKNNIPVIFYFNGSHADYHKPSDTPEKIEYDLLENRARLVFYTAWELANRENKILLDKPAE